MAVDDEGAEDIDRVGFGHRNDRLAADVDRVAVRQELVACGEAEREAVERALREGVAEGRICRAAVSGERVFFLLLEIFGGDEGGGIGIEPARGSGGAGLAETLAHEREETREDHRILRVGEARGPVATVVEEQLGLGAGGGAVAQIGEIEKRRAQKRIEFVAHGGGDAARDIFSDGGKAGKRQCDAVLPEAESQAVVVALAGLRGDGAAVEERAVIVGELLRLEIAAAERDPREHMPHRAVGLVSDPAAIQLEDRNLGAGGDSRAGTINKCPVAGDGIVDQPR